MLAPPVDDGFLTVQVGQLGIISFKKTWNWGIYGLYPRDIPMNIPWNPHFEWWNRHEALVWLLHTPMSCAFATRFCSIHTIHYTLIGSTLLLSVLKPFWFLSLLLKSLTASMASCFKSQFWWRFVVNLQRLCSCPDRPLVDVGWCWLHPKLLVTTGSHWWRKATGSFTVGHLATRDIRMVGQTRGGAVGVLSGYNHGTLKKLGYHMGIGLPNTCK